MPSDPATWGDLSGEGDPVPVEDVNNPDNGDSAKLIMDPALDFIRESVAEGEPFFVVIWFHTPHKPLVHPDTHQDLKGNIENMDAEIGRLRDELETLGVRDNTMLWLTSDNGPENGVNSPNETSTVRSIRSGGLFERKRSVNEGGVRVPGILEWPAKIGESGRATDFAAVTSDYYPTILDFLELSVPNQKPLDGISLRPVIEGTAGEREIPVGFHYASGRSWTGQRYKLVSTDRGNTWSLFDLESDPKQQNALATSANLAQQDQPTQDLFQEMLAQYQEWEDSIANDTLYSK
jgi:arylsulfatase A-like enzyme